MQGLPLAIYLILLATLSVATLFDCLKRRIPNWLSFSGWLIAPLMYLFLDGPGAIQGSLLGLGLVFVLTFPLFMAGWMGAGDVKLMTSVGAYVGIGMALNVLLGIFVTGGLFALTLLAANRVLGESFSRIKASYGLSVAARKAIYIGPDEKVEAVTLPYAVPIMVGTMATLFIMNNLM